MPNDRMGALPHFIFLFFIRCSIPRRSALEKRPRDVSVIHLPEFNLFA